LRRFNLWFDGRTMKENELFENICPRQTDNAPDRQTMTQTDNDTD